MFFIEKQQQDVKIRAAEIACLVARDNLKYIILMDGHGKICN